MLRICCDVSPEMAMDALGVSREEAIKYLSTRYQDLADYLFADLPAAIKAVKDSEPTPQPVIETFATARVAQ